jgi:hypothetical protein
MGLYADTKVRRFYRDGVTVTINPIFGSDGKQHAVVLNDLDMGARKELSDPQAIHEEVQSLRLQGWKEVLID